MIIVEYYAQTINKLTLFINITNLRKEILTLKKQVL